MNEQPTVAWQQYEAGKDYKRRIGLYETVRRNERFYRGDQWKGNEGDLPRPVFNLVRRITDHLVNSAVPDAVAIHYTDERLPFLNNAEMREKVTEGIRMLNKNASYRWRESRMNSLCYRALQDAAISGDGVFYCWWDNDKNIGQLYSGDIRTDLVDNTNLFVADVNKSDLQAQEYIILSGRASVRMLQKEALEFGVSEKDVQRIRADQDTRESAGDLSAYELSDTAKTTYLLKFYRKDGHVMMEKSTKECLISSVDTGLKFYPVAYFQWQSAKNSFHGTAPISDMIANQRYINTAYAMVMKHMSDTAFSKIVYDKSRIPEWSNEVGEAIAAMGGGNVGDAVSVVGTGKLQDRYLELIDSVIENTKTMMGATDSALGEEDAKNTSAILTLQEASRVGLRHVSAALSKCIGDLASIWADMLCTYCPPKRFLTVLGESGELLAVRPDYSQLKEELLRASAEVHHISAYTPAATVTLLDKLLAEGHITVRQYLNLLPAGTLSDRDTILENLDEGRRIGNE